MNQVEVSQKSAAQITQALKQGASANKNINNVCLVFAMRERTRFQVTVGSLRLAMAQEGYMMTVKDIEEVLIFFASVGIGKLHYNNKKRLTGLVEVKWTLQSIGRAALGEAVSVARAERQRRYANLPGTMQQKTGVPAPVIAAPLKDAPLAPPTPLAAPVTKHQVYLTTKVAGREVKFPYPTLLTSEEFMELIAELNEAGGGKPNAQDKGGGSH